MIQSFVKCFNPYFNSIKVQLERVRVMSHCTCIQNFNSIKVQLEQTCCAVLRQRWRNFNSIKVQLEPLQRAMIDSLEVLNFNSIKVQLELKLLLDFLGAQHISIP